MSGGDGLVFNAEKQRGGEAEGAVPGINIENRENPCGDIERGVFQCRRSRFQWPSMSGGDGVVFNAEKQRGGEAEFFYDKSSSQSGTFT